MLGHASPEELVQQLLAEGATVIALRRGAKGTLIGHRDSNVLVEVRIVGMCRGITG